MTDLDALVSSLLRDRPGLKVIEKRNHISATCGGKVFAYTREIGLVVKLPRSRVDELEQTGEATRLVMGSKKMAEWAVVAGPEDGDPGPLDFLLEESLAYVCGVSRKN